MAPTLIPLSSTTLVLEGLVVHFFTYLEVSTLFMLGAHLVMSVVPLVAPTTILGTL